MAFLLRKKQQMATSEFWWDLSIKVWLEGI